MLGVPVRFERREIINSQYAVGVRKSLRRYRGIVFGAHREHDSPPLELGGVLLKGRIGLADWCLLADLDVVHAVIADDAAPQSVVQVPD